MKERQKKPPTESPEVDEPPMPLEELARRMLAMPVKTREEMTPKKKAKPRKKK